MKLVCTLEVVHRKAASHGLSGKDKPIRVFAQVKRVSNEKPFILISSNKDLTGQQYVVENVQTIRNSFLHQGLMTIEMRDPEVNLLFRNAREEDLIKFLAQLDGIRNERCQAKSEHLQGPSKPINQNLDPCSETRRPLKRARVADQSEKSSSVEHKFRMDLQKREMTEIKRALKTNNTKLQVTRREDYPLKGFSRELEHIMLTCISLKRVDSRLLDLKHLRVLSLTGNRITSIECLASMESRLAELTLDSNCLDRISEDFFCSNSMKCLNFLSLADNKLASLPRSIIKLENVRTLILSKNVLRFLPYNLHHLRSLRKLLVNGNQLTFLPYTIYTLGLTQLDVSCNSFLRDYSNYQVPTPPITVQISALTSLFELAAESVKTHNFKNQVKRKNQIDDTLVGIPAVVYDALEMCKICTGCRHMVLRYKLYDIISTSNLAEETIRDTNSLLSKKVLCLSCCGDTRPF